jgi:hypothetical protein
LGDPCFPELQSELGLRNDQIADLQTQILSADQDKEKEGTSNWWDTSVTSLTEAKIALQVIRLGTEASF